MDPQQRLVLECCAEALELGERRATPAPPGGDGEDVGVFAAIETSDYAYLHQRAVDEGAASTDAYCGTGWHGCVGPNRVSYLFDLRGPSVALNTACSSSLTCVSVARHSLDARECGAALVGGANVQLQPHWSCAFTAAGMLSPTFRCRFGDDAADGYVRGEGVGVASIGHLEGCSGLAGLAKAALTLKHTTAPRSLHFRTPNAHVNWAKLNVTVLAAAEDLGAKTTAGVSSFGFGGALGHVAVTRAAVSDEDADDAREPAEALTLVPVAAHSAASLKQSAKRFATWASRLRRRGRAPVCADPRRAPGAPRPHRSAAALVGGEGLDVLAAKLEKVASSYEPPANGADRKSAGPVPRTGQGAAYVGMGRALYESCAAFRCAFDAAAAAVAPLLEGAGGARDRGARSRRGRRRADDGAAAALLTSPAASQPALFCFEYALAKLVLAEVGREQPDAVVGRSARSRPSASRASSLSTPRPSSSSAARA
ncbi:hypothetical protein JL720_4022 [Aureococcus anophagefferens]|nr:hypothetical protein JL720_4022 [Aureococcus anophagefferens]